MNNLYKPHLATDVDLNLLRFPCCVLPKIDGVRGVNPSGKLLGRSLKPFNNKYVSVLFDGYTGFDGEITVGEHVTGNSLCRLTTSAVNTESGEPDFHWNIFDLIGSNKPYIERYEALVSPDPRIHIVPMRMCSKMEDINQCESDWSAYEGLIIRDPYGISKNGRSTIREGAYLRLKRFIQEDAIVLYVTEGESNFNEPVVNELGNSVRPSHKMNKSQNGTIGSLECLDVKTGKVITVSPGKLTAAERRYYFENQGEIVGKMISYKHFPHGAKDKPRFPTFVHMRIPSDFPLD